MGNATNLLGFQSQIATDAYRTMVRATWPSTLKVIIPGGLDEGILTEWRARRPDGMFVVRPYFPDENLDPAKINLAVSIAVGLKRFRPVLECPINEAHQTSASDIARLSAYSVRFVLDCQSAGVVPAVGVFSEGNPSNLAWWQQFYPALRAARAAGGYLALHEYGLPGLGMEDWHLLRHRRVWDALPEDCRLPILVTECGIDGGIEGRREQGWRAYMDARAYAEWLRRYHAELAKDAYVHGATLFLCGGNDQWRQFDLTDEVDLRGPLTEQLDMPPRWAPQEAPMRTIKGVDVSNWQRYPDFATVKAVGYEFAFIKVSEDDYGDTDYYDPYAAGNWANAKAAGLVRGVYHFVRPSKSTPAESVTVLQRAIEKIGGLAPGDLVALDIEDEKVLGSQHVWVAEALDLTERVLGFAPFKYSGDWYTSSRDLEHADLGKYPTWWASYQNTAPAPETGWGPIRIWQHSAHATVPGIFGDCDVDVFHGSVADLRALGLPAPAVPAEVLAALDTLWTYVGPNVDAQRAIADVKVAIGLQAA